MLLQLPIFAGVPNCRHYMLHARNFDISGDEWNRILYLIRDVMDDSLDSFILHSHFYFGLER